MRPRKLWSQLAGGTRKRKLAFFRKQGLTDRQIAARYNSGKLGPQSASRGHAATPEHGITDALKKPQKYQKYINKKTEYLGGEGNSEDIARALNRWRDKALESMRRLQNYVYYKDATVVANVFGGATSESGTVPGMSLVQAQWTAHADIEEIRSMASEQYRGNPWFYH